MRAEFTKPVKMQAWLRAGGYCENCGMMFGGKPVEYDHITPCEFGGGNELENCEVLCVECHKRKTGKYDIVAIAKSNRVRYRHAHISRARRPIGGGRLFDGTPVRYPRTR